MKKKTENWPKNLS